MNFEESLEYLLSLGHETLTMKLGLRNTELLLESLGNPQKSFPSVQIAGTNGKGSTAVALDSICRAAGIKTGLFTSPHLISITERIVISGALISPDEFSHFASIVRTAADELVRDARLPALPTFFEHVTTIALLAFKEAQVSLAILETGLGGRLDATTVAAAETIAITPLALDHQEYLGESLEEIAAEKAAIIRPGVQAVIAPQPQQALDVILWRCDECSVTPDLVNESEVKVHDSTSDGRFRVTINTGEETYKHVLLQLRGKHQIVNCAVAIHMAEILSKRGFAISAAAIVAGIETANHTGRLERYEGPPTILLDGAHNSSGALALRKYLEEFVDGPLTLIFGAMRDKKLEEIARILFPVASQLVLTRPDNPRAAEIDMLLELSLGMITPKNTFVAATTEEALAMAKEVTAFGGTICATGSLYLVGEMKRIIENAHVS
ncbi:MAG TPA: folylpolyglutamate synthase/dihydrofolate synthase family protein [Pyrinomonadaceae bacterium]|nr:folylpolyglutamate synthase/dihydrofolate synthase family protein [Pyrinomonadaceae bacterium]